jgi:hypothetical protein
MGNYQEDILDMIAVDTGENIYDDSLEDLDKMLLVKPTGEIIFNVTSIDEQNNPDAWFLKWFYFDKFNDIDNLSLGLLKMIMKTDFYDNLNYLPNKDKTFIEIINKAIEKKYLRLPSGT